MLLKNRAMEEFNIGIIGSEQMETWVSHCVEMYEGNPSWIDIDDNIDSVNFAKAICSETARLATLGIGIHVDGSARATWLQEQLDAIYYRLRHWVEYGCAYGTVILKPSGKTVSFYTPDRFIVTHETNNAIDGVVFFDTEKMGDKWYTKMEYHRFEVDSYCVTNKCFVGDTENDLKKDVDISKTPWAYLVNDVSMENTDKPVFAVLRTPQANNIDIDSPFGLPVFSEAVQELRDLDVAYSRNAKEILNSKRTVLLDSDSMVSDGQKVSNNAKSLANKREQLGLPDYIKNVRGDGREMFYQEINPTLQTDMRLNGINALMSQIGYKIGFSNGHFVFNESRGIQTATQVEADQQRTIQFIKDVRDKLEDCLNGLLYSLSVFADLYELAPAGAWEAVFDFGDITYNREEDRARWWGYVQSGKVPAWMFFVKFEGMTEEEAKAMVEEATPKQPKLFGAEE